MPDRQRRETSGGMLRMAGVELTDLAPQRLVAVHDALGIARGARGERDQRRVRRVGVHGALHGLVGQQVVEIASDQSDDRHVDAHVRVEFHSPELLGGDEHLRSGGRQDVTDFLSAVEVHDRHHDGAEQGRGPERRGRFHPVGQLERDDVTGTHPAGLQTSGQPPRDLLDVAERPGVRPDGRVHPKRRLRLCLQRVGQQCTQACRPSTSPRIRSGPSARGGSHDWGSLRPCEPHDGRLRLETQSSQ